MTEARARKSVARKKLDFALGDARISLARLFFREFDDLLRGIFKELDLGELRGFKPLRDLLARHPGSFTVGQRMDPTENVKMGSSGEMKGYLEEDFSLHNTHVVRVCRGVLDQAITYRRHESGEETTSRVIAASWGRDAYIQKVEEVILVLRRNGALYNVRYSYEKIPHKDEMIIGFVEAKSLILENFRQFFGDRYPTVARDLIWELKSLANLTARELEGKAQWWQRSAIMLERISGAIME